jgi:hypothetical protein
MIDIGFSGSRCTETGRRPAAAGVNERPPQRWGPRGGTSIRGSPACGRPIRHGELLDEGRPRRASSTSVAVRATNDERAQALLRGQAFVGHRSRRRRTPIIRLRLEFDRFAREFIAKLGASPEYAAKAEALKREFLGRAEVKSLSNRLSTSCGNSRARSGAAEGRRRRLTSMLNTCVEARSDRARPRGRAAFRRDSFPCFVAFDALFRRETAAPTRWQISCSVSRHAVPAPRRQPIHLAPTARCAP